MGVRIFVMLIFRDPVLFFNTQSIWQFVEVLFTLQFKHWTGLGQSYLAHRYVDGSYYTAHKPCASPLHRVWRSWNVTCTALQRTMTTAKDKLPRYESVRTAFLFCLIIVTHLKYSWSALKVHAQKTIKTRRVTTHSRPRTDISWRGESNSTVHIFMWPIFDLFQNNFHDNIQAKVCTADLDLSRQILLCWGLRWFWGASVCWRIDFLVISGSQAGVRALDNWMSHIQMIAM